MAACRAVLGAITFALIATTAPSAQTARTEAERLGRDILKELIETDTTHSGGSTTVAAERMGARLIAAGFPKADVQVVGGADRKGNLVVRYRGAGTAKPVLFLAHLDVVEARREDWTLDPFVLTERDGFFYGRGTLDVKGGAATLVTAFARLRQEGFKPTRDLILALTADEEGGPDNGVRWLLENRRNLIDAEYCINVDSGGGELRDGKVVALDVQAAEKVFTSFTLTVKNPGGHSSLPTKDNAIYRLAAGLQRLSAFEFPMRTSEVTRAYFAAMSKLAPPSDAAAMRALGNQPFDQEAATRLGASSAFYNALLRTTCVPTLLQGGHAENALPQTAQAPSIAACSRTIDRTLFSRYSYAPSRMRKSRLQRSDRPFPVLPRRSCPKSSARLPTPRGRSTATHRSCRSWKPARPMACCCATPAPRSTASTGLPTTSTTSVRTAKTSAFSCGRITRDSSSRIS